MGSYQRTPKKVARVIRYTGLGVRSVGPVGDFLDRYGYSFDDFEKNFRDSSPVISSSADWKPSD